MSVLACLSVNQNVRVGVNTYALLKIHYVGTYLHIYLICSFIRSDEDSKIMYLEWEVHIVLTSVVSFLHRAVSANLFGPLLPSPAGHWLISIRSKSISRTATAV